MSFGLVLSFTHVHAQSQHTRIVSTDTIVSRDGAAGQNLHGGYSYGRGPNYQFVDGKPRTEQVNIGWVLRDVSTAAGDGGLMLVRTHSSPPAHEMRLS